ncbi:classical arabinogalactan protein 4-like [Morus notabilis]|uniref:classical arabinogalactan protein 4-like n=1 Tax=Morus notabilis TaxID=981085 RepID=UPI000CED3A2F|nr:classical arabinogalactan protein 4-like [Morus notabilis]
MHTFIREYMSCYIKNDFEESQDTNHYYCYNPPPTFFLSFLYSLLFPFLAQTPSHFTDPKTQTQTQASLSLSPPSKTLFSQNKTMGFPKLQIFMILGLLAASCTAQAPTPSPTASPPTATPPTATPPTATPPTATPPAASPTPAPTASPPAPTPAPTSTPPAPTPAPTSTPPTPAPASGAPTPTATAPTPEGPTPPAPTPLSPSSPSEPPAPSQSPSDNFAPGLASRGVISGRCRAGIAGTALAGVFVAVALA